LNEGGNNTLAKLLIVLGIENEQIPDFIYHRRCWEGSYQVDAILLLLIGRSLVLLEVISELYRFGQQI
jgi:hypothetical protein